MQQYSISEISFLTVQRVVFISTCPSFWKGRQAVEIKLSLLRHAVGDIAQQIRVNVRLLEEMEVFISVL